MLANSRMVRLGQHTSKQTTPKQRSDKHHSVGSSRRHHPPSRNTSKSRGNQIRRQNNGNPDRVLGEQIEDLLGVEDVDAEEEHAIDCTDKKQDGEVHSLEEAVIEDAFFHYERFIETEEKEAYAAHGECGDDLA